MSTLRMKLIPTLMTVMAVVVSCRASGGWDFTGGHGGGGWDSGEISLGEISLGSGGHKLPTITLEHTGHGGSHGWLGSSIYDGWTGNSVSHGGWDSGSSYGHGWEQPFKHIVTPIAVPVFKDVEIKIPELVTKEESKPYPILVPVSKPVPFEVVKTVVKTVEKKVPTSVEKVIPVKVDKPVPFTVYKSVPYPVVKHVPIKIPIHKTIHHYSHGHHNHHH